MILMQCAKFEQLRNDNWERFLIYYTAKRKRTYWDSFVKTEFVMVPSILLNKDKKLIRLGVESDVAFEFDLFHEKLYVLKARGS